MKTKVFLLLELFFGIPKTLLINFKYLPIYQAVKLPIIVSWNCKLCTLHGKIEIDDDNLKIGMIKLGFGAYGLIDHKYNRGLFSNTSGGVLYFKGSARFGPGFKIANNGKLSIGKNFNMTGNSTIICNNEIFFGSDCLLSWEDLIMDNDFHEIIIDAKAKEKTRPISIGNHVWVGCRSTILKGSSIRDDSIIAAGSIVSGKFESSNLIIGGNSATLIRSYVNWKK
jgi:acetyltransferase-like isoleucine patch superfamily enzyme